MSKSFTRRLAEIDQQIQTCIDTCEAFGLNPNAYQLLLDALRLERAEIAQTIGDRKIRR